MQMSSTFLKKITKNYFSRLLKALLTIFSSGAFVKLLTTGTIISEIIIANAPALMGESRLRGQFRLITVCFIPSNADIFMLKRNICTNVMPIPVQRLDHTATGDAFFRKSP